jgi:hypothetical protein
MSLRLLVVLGVVPSPLRAAAMVPKIFAHEGAAPYTDMVRVEVGRSLRAERGGVPKDVYDDALDKHDGGTRPLARDSVQLRYAEADSYDAS